MLGFTIGALRIARAIKRMAPQRRWDYLNSVEVGMPIDPEERLLVWKAGPWGWGDNLRGLRFAFWSALVTGRALIIDWPVPPKLRRLPVVNSTEFQQQLIFSVFVPKELAWNVTPIAESAWPKVVDEEGCKSIRPTTMGPGRLTRPTASIRRALQLVWSEGVGEIEEWPRGSRVRLRPFKGADVAALSNFPMDPNVAVDVMTDSDLSVVVGRFRMDGEETARQRARSIGLAINRNPIRELFQLANPMAEVFERTIVRTLFLWDHVEGRALATASDAGPESLAYRLHEWVQRDRPSREPFLKVFADGLSLHLPFGALAHCRVLTLSRAIRNRLDGLMMSGDEKQKNLATELRSNFFHDDFTIIATHFRMGDGAIGRGLVDRRLTMDHVSVCVGTAFEVAQRNNARYLPLVLFMSDSFEARQKAVEEFPRHVLLPQAPGVDQNQVHSGDFRVEESVVRTQGMVSEWLMLTAADGLAYSRSGFGQQAILAVNYLAQRCDE